MILLNNERQECSFPKHNLHSLQFCSQLQSKKTHSKLIIKVFVRLHHCIFAKTKTFMLNIQSHRSTYKFHIFSELTDYLTDYTCCSFTLKCFRFGRW